MSLVNHPHRLHAPADDSAFAFQGLINGAIALSRGRTNAGGAVAPGARPSCTSQAAGDEIIDL